MSYRVDIELNKYDQAFRVRFSEAWDQYLACSWACNRNRIHQHPGPFTSSPISKRLDQIPDRPPRRTHPLQVAHHPHDSSDEARRYLLDLTTMLADKARKTRAYLRSAEMAMVYELDDLDNFERA
ncbi:hypothetical protein MMC07_003749 [Pseudocyphellaria aurata]|nr:hypothetical protein [Pseudocyphellaria aurata]